MASDTPWHVHWSATARNAVMTLAAICGAFVFIRWGAPQSTAQLKITTAEAEIKAHDSQLIGIKEKLHIMESRIAEARATKLQADIDRDTTPVLAVKPVVDQTSSDRAVREIRIETHFENIGRTDVAIEPYLESRGVFCHAATQEATDIIERTQKLFDIERQLSPFSIDPPNLVEPAKSQYEALRGEFDRLHKDCPHGRIFLVGPGSQDVKWEKVD